MKGGTTFSFVTGGIESAVAKAKQAAGEGNVLLGGGANVVQQALVAQLVDELELHITPVVLGGGERLLEGVTHITYRVVDPGEVLPGSTSSRASQGSRGV